MTQTVDASESRSPEPGFPGPQPGLAPQHNSPRLAKILWALGALSIATTAWRSRNFIYDDAFISFRYAQNLLDHGELAWNVGERVEGYTNFLHVLVTASTMAAGFSGPTGARLINLTAAIALIVMYRRIANRLVPGAEHAVARAVGGLFLLGSACLPLWLLGGLESITLASLELAAIGLLLPVFAGGVPLLRRLTLAGSLFALATMTRPDAVVIAGSVLLAIVCFAPVSIVHRLRASLVAGLAMSTIVLAHVAWRYSYYGDVVPNTFHAKVGIPTSGRLDFGLEYTAGALALTPIVPVALVLAAVSRSSREIRPVVAMLAMTITIHVAYVVWAGGDHLPAARFFVPLIAPAALLVASTLSKRSAWTQVAIAIAVFSAVLTPFAGAIEFHGGAEGGEIVGNYISETWPDDSLVALNVAGATPYYASNHRFVDMLGLNDAVIARRDPVPIRTEWQKRPGHVKGDGAYVLAREPDYVILAGALGSDVDEGLFLGDLELAESAEFANCYTRQSVRFGAADLERYRDGPPLWSEATFIYYERTCP